MPGRVTEENVEKVFTYHAPTAEQLLAYQAIREQAKGMAHTILKYVHPCADQQAALRKLREAVMTANAAIALSGEV